MPKIAAYMVIWTRYGALQERYEYDAYGSSYILEPNFAADPDGGEGGEPRRQASGLNMQLMRRRVGEG